MQADAPTASPGQYAPSRLSVCAASCRRRRHAPLLPSRLAALLCCSARRPQQPRVAAERAAPVPGPAFRLGKASVLGTGRDLACSGSRPVSLRPEHPKRPQRAPWARPAVFGDPHPRRNRPARTEARPEAFRVAWRNGGEPRLNTNSESLHLGFRVTTTGIPSHCHADSESLYLSELAETGSRTEDLCSHLSLSQSSLSRQCNSVSAIDRIRVLKSRLELLQ